MRTAFTLLLAAAGLAVAPTALAFRLPRAWIADETARIRRDDLGSPLARGEGNPLWRPGAPIALRALRDEVIAFQVIVEANEVPLSDVKVELMLSVPGVTIERFVEHYVNVTGRSHNARRPRESLGWSPRSRPSDDEHTGFLPDALIPVELGPAFAPYPMAITARHNGAVWVDLTVPRDAPAGRARGEVMVTDGNGVLTRIPIDLEIGASVLPYRAVSFLAYYNYGTLAARIGHAEAAERQLFQLLHRHQIDAFASISSLEDVDRLRPALDGSLFTAGLGYAGPGAGVAPAAVALGAYGSLDAPTPDKIRVVEAVVPRIPEAVDDVLLYAADEDCESPLGPAWRRALRGSPSARRVRIGHSCAEDPRDQDVDLVLVPADAFQSEPSSEARKRGRDVWVYNGALPRAGTLLLDADPSGLLANGWIAASHDVGRWFLWETTFWNDDNAGGRGPINPFVTAESFHNRQGDTALGDGMLLYPGTERGPFAAHSLGFDGVIPSIRLKNLRRGIQDAGYVALARAARPAEADAVVTDLLPAVLDELSATAPSELPRGDRLTAAREALRALIPDGAAQPPAETRAVLKAAAEGRQVHVAALRRRRLMQKGALGLGAVAALVALGVFLRRRAHKPR